jgi:hypothetical protein
MNTQPTDRPATTIQNEIDGETQKGSYLAQALEVVARLGDDRSWWLRKMETEIREKQARGEEVCGIEIHNMLRQYASDCEFVKPVVLPVDEAAQAE